MKKVKLFLCAALIPFLLPTFRISNCKEQQDFIQKSSNTPVIKDAVSPQMSKLDNINSLIECYLFYRSSDISDNLTIADVLNENNADNKIFEFKMIDNSDYYYDYGSNSVLNEEKYVVEFLIGSSLNDLSKEYYVPSEFEVSRILSKVKTINKDNEIFNRLVNSLNIEYDFKSSLPRIQTWNRVFYSEEVDNQNVLNQFLKTKNIEYPQLQMTSQNVYKPTIDDQIVNLISKDKFKTPGEYKKGGAEWGFYVNTFSDYGNNTISNVLIYDIENTKASVNSKDVVTVKNVLSMNYKYDSTFDVVYKDVPNNYCIGNPQYKASLQYVKFSDNLYDFEIPKNGNDDYGYFIHSYLAKFVGVGKQYANKINDLQNLAIAVGSIALSAITQDWSLSSQVLIGLTYNWASNLALNLGNVFSNKLNQNESNGRIEKFITDVSEESSFDVAKADGELLKTISICSPSFNGSNEPSKTNPMLYKDERDYFSYGFSLIKPDGNNKYTMLVNHKLDIQIFNDNTYFFKWDPDYIGDVTSSWSYGYVHDIKRKDVEVNNGQEIVVQVSVENSQNIYFTPTSDGTYDILVYDMPANTQLSLGSITKSAGINKNTTDPFGKSLKIPNSNYLKINTNLKAGTKYKINVSGDGHITGNAKFRILKSSNCSLRTGSVQYGSNNVSKYIENSGFSMNSEFVPESDGIYTFNINPTANSNNTDTFIELLNGDFKRIIKDDDGWGDRTAGVRVALIKGERYYIVSRMYLESNKGTYNVNIFKQNYIPSSSQSNLIFFQEIGNKTLSNDYLISFGEAKSFTFTASYGSSITGIQKNVWLYIYDSDLSLLSSEDVLNKHMTYSFSRDRLYIIRMTVPVINTGGVSLNCQIS